MPNNFEKQVKEKMDELQFVPTAPVWEHIEKQIRAKKDRRRFFLWLPFVLLLTGTGTWLLHNRQNNKGVSQKVGVQNPKEIGTRPGYNNETIKENKQEENKHSTGSAAPTINNFKKITVANSPTRPYSEHAPTVNGITIRQVSKAISHPQQANELLKEQEPAIEINETEIDSRPPVPYIPGRLLSNPAFILIMDSVKAMQVTPGTGNVVDSPIVKVKKDQEYHWQIGINASAGYAGISKSFDVIPASFQADVGSVSGSYNSNGYSAAPVNKNYAYAIGVQARRNVTPRLSIELGINYRYYSTQVKVGQKLQDTLIGLNNSVSRSYMGYGPYLQNYSNRYHFLSLPVSLVWRTGAHMPLYLEGSFSLQQMIHTNGLIFSARTGNYYTDQSAYYKTQFMAGLGLSYELMPSSLFIGPQAQFGLRNMEKNGSSNHLVYAGLQVRYFFKNIK